MGNREFVVRTLAIDTSLANGSVAAVDAGREVMVPLGPAGDHARRLASALVEAATRLGWHPRDVELVAVVRGPGSFTGLRVGVASAKAIAWTGGARLVGVSGFELIAERTAGWLGAPEPVAIAFDAGRGEVYSAVLRRDATTNRWRVGPSSLDRLDAWIAGLPPCTVVSGPGLLHDSDRWAARPDIRMAPPEACVTDARDAARMAHTIAMAGGHDDPATLVPEYLRPSYADERQARTP